MSNRTVLIAMVLVSSSYAADTLFTDDFSSNDLSREWIVFGDPLPETVDSLGLPPPCFHNNGDAMWGSGIISRRLFDIARGLTVECDIFLECHERGTWVDAALGVVTPGFRDTGQGEELRLVEMDYGYNGELAWGRPHLQGVMKFIAFRDDSSRFFLELYHQNQFLDGWHRFRIEIHSDRSIDYFIDDSLYCRSTVSLSDTVTLVRVRLGNRSSDWGIALHDNLRVFVR